METFISLKKNRVLVNSLPKSGTHLLTRTVEVFGYREYGATLNHTEKMLNALGLGIPKYLIYRQAKNSLKKGKVTTENKIGIGAFSPYFVNKATFEYWLDAIPYGQYIQGHIPFTPELATIIAKLNYFHLFIIRDPRAVIASLIPFILDSQSARMGTHFLQDDFREMSQDQRLRFILEGGTAQKAGVKVESFADVYRSMLAWRDDPDCLLVRFEDLVGEQGGGNADKQEKAVKGITKYMGIEFDGNIRSKLTKIYDTSSRTFRIGKIDGWKDSMDAESVAHLTEYCEPLRNEAGYGSGI
uniref:Sulfotransferase family protein n=1 Tax=Candidatus Kentrum sp. LPFa TaxID=2126335 RepID=A0A450WPR3_9GAMM|nr:MAG: Sulfotransferase family protein [Candidatus Kentron sp. LPFa]